MILSRYLVIILGGLLSLSSYSSDTLRLELYHQTAEYKLNKEHLNYLDSNLKPYQEFQLVSVEITASCDDIGSVASNKILAKNRADAVHQYLVKRFDTRDAVKKLKAVGEIALQSQDSVSERAGNRKVELILVLKEQEITMDNIKVGQKLAIENLLFMGGYPVLLPESYPALDSLVAKLTRRSELKFKIIGHVCCWPYPGDGYNNASKKNDLSLMRAKAVYDYLIEKGIAAKRMSYLGKGGTEPLGKGDKYDRRVEIEIVE